MAAMVAMVAAVRVLASAHAVAMAELAVSVVQEYMRRIVSLMVVFMIQLAMLVAMARTAVALLTWARSIFTMVPRLSPPALILREVAKAHAATEGTEVITLFKSIIL